MHYATTSGIGSRIFFPAVKVMLGARRRIPSRMQVNLDAETGVDASLLQGQAEVVIGVGLAIRARLPRSGTPPAVTRTVKPPLEKPNAPTLSRGACGSLVPQLGPRTAKTLHFAYRQQQSFPPTQRLTATAASSPDRDRRVLELSRKGNSAARRQGMNT